MYSADNIEGAQMKFLTTPIVLFTMIGLMLATMPKIATAQTRPVPVKQCAWFL
jgi:hypothetical protein